MTRRRRAPRAPELVNPSGAFTPADADAVLGRPAVTLDDAAEAVDRITVAAALDRDAASRVAGSLYPALAARSGMDAFVSCRVGSR